MFERDFREALLSVQTLELAQDRSSFVPNLEQNTMLLAKFEHNLPEDFLPTLIAAFVENDYKKDLEILLAGVSLQDFKVSLADCIVACFSAYVIAIIWKMSLSPKGLHDLAEKSYLNFASEVATAGDPEGVSATTSDTDPDRTDIFEDI